MFIRTNHKEVQEMRTSSRKNAAVAISAIVIVTGSVCFGVNKFKNTATGSTVQTPPAFHYSVIEPAEVTLVTELPGRVSALMVSEVRPQVSGIVTERLFAEGADVEAGQVLYQIDPSLFESAFNNARAALAKALANEKSTRLLSARYSALVKTNAVSKQEHDDAVAAHQQALADVEAARQAVETAGINLGYTKIKAPVSGTIGHSSVTPGALVTQHQPAPLATIQQLDQVYVDVTHPSREMLKLRRALASGALQGGSRDTASAKLRLEDGTIYGRMPSANDDAGREREAVTGSLLFSDVTIDKSTGVVTIRALFDNPDRILLPGMYVRAIVEEGTSSDAVLVPQKLVMRDTRDRAYVYVLSKDAPQSSLRKSPQDSDDESAQMEKALQPEEYYVAIRHIEIDRHYNNNWLVSGGLLPGDRLLAEGLQKVRPGMVVAGVEQPASVASLSSDAHSEGGK